MNDSPTDENQTEPEANPPEVEEPDTYDEVGPDEDVEPDYDSEEVEETGGGTDE